MITIRNYLCYILLAFALLCNNQNSTQLNAQPFFEKEEQFKITARKKESTELTSPSINNNDEREISDQILPAGHRRNLENDFYFPLERFPNEILIEIVSFSDAVDVLSLRSVSHRYKKIADEASEIHKDIRFQSLCDLRTRLHTIIETLKLKNPSEISFSTYWEILKDLRDRTKNAKRLTLQDKERIVNILYKEAKPSIESHLPAQDTNVSWMQKFSKKVLFWRKPSEKIALDETSLKIWSQLALIKAFQNNEITKFQKEVDELLVARTDLLRPFVFLLPTETLVQRFSLYNTSLRSTVTDNDLKMLAQELTLRKVDGIKAIENEARRYTEERGKTYNSNTKERTWREWANKENFKLPAFYYSLVFEGDRYHFNNPWVYYVAAKAFFLAEKWREAIECFTKATQGVRYVAKDYTSMGYAYFMLKNHANAKQHYERAKTFKECWLDDKHSRALAFTYLKLEHWNKAADWYSDLLYNFEGTAEDCCNAGYAFLQISRWRKSTEYYSMALSKKETQLSSVDYANIGYAYLAQDKYNESEKYYSIALKKGPNLSSEDYGNAGFIYTKLGQWEEAAKCYSVAIRKNPLASFELYVDTSWAFYKIGEYEQARGYLNSVIALLHFDYERASLAPSYKEKIKVLSNFLNN